MPQLIYTLPELILQQHRDVYVIRFYDAEPHLSSTPAQELLERWFKQHCPGLEMQALAHRPSDGLHTVLNERLVWVDFTDTALTQFEAAWESPDGGSIDERFQCFYVPFAGFEAQAQRAVAKDKMFED